MSTPDNVSAPLQSFGLIPDTTPPAVACKQENKSPKFELKDETMHELLNRNVPEPEYILSPWLCVGESALVSARAGVGKTFFGMEVAKTISMGGMAFADRWEAAVPQRVVYLDGEMGAAAMRKRGLILNVDTENFVYVDALNQENPVGINLASELFQDAILHLMRFREARVLIADNLATLYHPGENPNSSLYMDALNAFILKMRREKIAVIIIDHEGKGGAGGPRGTSAKIDIAHVAITLERPESAGQSDGARFIVRFTKNRGFHGEGAAPFTAELCDGQWVVSEFSASSGAAKTKSPSEQNREAMCRLFDQGKTPKDVIDLTGFSKSTVYDCFNKHYPKWRESTFGLTESDTYSEFDDFGG